MITDLTVSFCSTYNVFSKCKLDPAEWHRVEKDLYLNTGWVHQGYVHVKRKKEEELESDEKVIIDVKCGRLDPAVGEKNKGNEEWEPRPAGVWILRSSKRHESDSKEAVTAIDVLYGADAVEPRLGWRIRNTPLLLESPAESAQAHISIRRGRSKKVETQSPRIRKDGKFKIMQVADLHLSTGVGKCRDAEPPEHGGRECEADTRTLQFVSKLLDAEEPDLVVLSGDQVNGETAPDVQSVCHSLARSYFHGTPLILRTPPVDLQIRRSIRQPKRANPLRRHLRQPRRQRPPVAAHADVAPRIFTLLPFPTRPLHHRRRGQLRCRGSRPRNIVQQRFEPLHARHPQLVTG